MHLFLTIDQFRELYDWVNLFGLNNSVDILLATSISDDINQLIFQLIGDRDDISVFSYKIIDIDDHNFINGLPGAIKISSFSFDNTRLDRAEYVEINQLHNVLEFWFINENELRQTNEPITVFYQAGVMCNDHFDIAAESIGELHVTKQLHNYCALVGQSLTYQSGYFWSHTDNFISQLRYQLCTSKILTFDTQDIKRIRVGIYEIVILDNYFYLIQDDLMYIIPFVSDIDYTSLKDMFAADYVDKSIDKVRSIFAQKMIKLGFNYGVDANIVKVFTSNPPVTFLVMNEEY